MPDSPIPDSALISTTQVYDIEQLEIKEPGLKEFLVQLTQTVNNLSLIINMKDTGYYFLSEFVNSQYYFPIEVPPGDYNTVQQPRAVYRKVIWWDKPLPNAGTDTQAHNIDIESQFRFTRIYGCTTNPNFPEAYIPLPYASPVLNKNIELSVDFIDVIITTAFDYSDFTSAFIVLEYVKES
jgi:hypothetical protein